VLTVTTAFDGGNPTTRQSLRLLLGMRCFGEQNFTELYEFRNSNSSRCNPTKERKAQIASEKHELAKAKICHQRQQKIQRSPSHPHHHAILHIKNSHVVSSPYAMIA
jgi:hypothetical protein